MEVPTSPMYGPQFALGGGGEPMQGPWRGKLCMGSGPKRQPRSQRRRPGYFLVSYFAYLTRTCCLLWDYGCCWNKFWYSEISWDVSWTHGEQSMTELDWTDWEARSTRQVYLGSSGCHPLPSPALFCHLPAPSHLSSVSSPSFPLQEEAQKKRLS